MTSLPGLLSPSRGSRAALLCAVLLAATGCELESLPTPTTTSTGATDAGPVLGPPVPVRGRAFVFGPAGGYLVGATISSSEAPDRTTTVRDDGTFDLEVPSGMRHSFLARRDGYQDTQTATFDIGLGGLDQVGFQVPTNGLVKILAGVVNVALDPERCQIATTVSAPGTAPYGGSGVGEPDVTVSIEPALPKEQGPVYFAYLSESLILPDRTLVATSIDGGVLFLNVAPGEYVLSAQKPGRTIPPVNVTCRAGLLVNAAPPHGLQVQ